MSKCQVIPLHGKVAAKHAEPKVASFSAMLADGVAGVLPEQRHAQIYNFQRPVLKPADMSGMASKDMSSKHDVPHPDR